MGTFFVLAANLIARPLIAAGLNATIAGVLGNIIIGAASIAISGLLRPKEPAPPAVKYSAVINQSISARRTGVGRFQLGGIRAFFDSREGRLDQIIVMHQGEISQIHSFWVGDISVELEAGTGDCLTPPFMDEEGDNYVRIKSRLGKPNDTVYEDMLELWPDVWTEDHRLRGLATMWVRFNSSDPEIFNLIFPESYNTPVRAVCDLAELFDPRTGVTEWSDNASLAIRYYLVYKEGYGRTLTVDDIDEESFEAFADICDEQVMKANGTTEKRYRLWGMWDLTDDPKSVMARMKAASDAELYENAEGKIAIRGGSWIEPTVNIEDKHILSWDLEQGRDKLAAFNELKIIYTDPQQDYQNVEAPRWINFEDQAIRGVISQTLECDMSPSASQAQRVAKIHERKENPEWRGTIITTLMGLAARYQRVVTINIPELGIVNHPVWVRSHGIRADLTACELAISSLGPEAYSWNAATEEGDATPPPSSTRPDLTLPEPENLSLDAELRQFTTETTAPVVFATVDPPPRKGLRLQAKIRTTPSGPFEAMSVAAGSLTAVSAPLVDGEEYGVLVRWITTRGTAGPYADEETIMVDLG